MVEVEELQKYLIAGFMTRISSNQDIKGGGIGKEGLKPKKGVVYE
jgi:hypothetical protein